MTFPITDGILPADVSELIDDRAIGDARVLRLKLKNNKSCAVICLPQSVVWISPVPLRGIGIENDRMSGSARDISFEHGHDDVRALEPRAPFTIESSWLNISDRLGFVSSGDGFRYTPAGKYNTRSVAVDRIEPIKASVWQMLPHATAEQTSAAASAFSVTTDANTLHLTVMDRDGMRYRIVQDLADGSIHVEQ
jgi:hypothetical protein